MTELLGTDGRESRPSEQPPIVEAIGVSKRYGATIALHDARIRVVAGESHALVGRNGAGKSTLVGILTGLRVPESGEIRFSGEPAPPASDREAWRTRVACVYQHSTIIPDLTVAENLFVNRQPTERGFISWTAVRRQARHAARADGDASALVEEVHGVEILRRAGRLRAPGLAVVVRRPAQRRTRAHQHALS